MRAAAWENPQAGKPTGRVVQVNEERQSWERQQAEDLAQQQRKGPGWHGKLEGYAPVQGEGSVDGHAWYFRARGVGWSFQIAEPAEVDWATADNSREVAGWSVEDEAWAEEEFAASYMPYATAWAIIQRCIARFREQGRPLTYPAACQAPP